MPTAASREPGHTVQLSLWVRLPARGFDEATPVLPDEACGSCAIRSGNEESLVYEGGVATSRKRSRARTIRDDPMRPVDSPGSPASTLNPCVALGWRAAQPWTASSLSALEIATKANLSNRPLTTTTWRYEGFPRLPVRCENRPTAQGCNPRLQPGIRAMTRPQSRPHIALSGPAAATSRQALLRFE